MSENKESENLLEVIISAIFIPQSEAHQNLIKSINISIGVFSNWVKSVNWQELIENYQINSRIADDIVQQLRERNIDLEILHSINIEEVLELYVKSYKAGIVFADLVEDNIQLFDSFEYTKALTYIDVVDKRQKQIVLNKIKPIGIEDSIIKNLRFCDDDIANIVKLALIEYENGNIHISEAEKSVLKLFKDNPYLTNKNIANILGYTDRGIENICREIREKFYLDFSDNWIIKRNLLINIAKHLKID